MSKTFCSLRWNYPIYYMFDGGFAYCCRTPKIDIPLNEMKTKGSMVFSEMDYFQHRRSEMLLGRRHLDCESCWKLEDAGVKSPRQSKFEHIPEATELVEKKEFKTLVKKAYPEILEIVLSKTCDAKCVYCNEHYSTQWINEKIKFKDIQASDVTAQVRRPEIDELFWKWVEEVAAPTVRRIGFIGGEPLIIPALYDSMNRILEIFKKTNRSYRAQICITTNLNSTDKALEKFMGEIKKWSEVFDIVIQVSMESTDEQLEYIRSGVSWPQLLKNFNALMAMDGPIEVSVLPTLNTLALEGLENMIHFVYETSRKHGKPIPILENIVTLPAEQSPLNCSFRFAPMIRSAVMALENYAAIETSEVQRNNYLRYAQYLSNVENTVRSNTTPQTRYENLLFSFCKKLDSRRNTNFDLTFPRVKAALLHSQPAAAEGPSLELR